MYVAYQSSRGGVSDFINRLINAPEQTWVNLKAEITTLFAKITDHMQVFSLLRNLQQNEDENVQLYAESCSHFCEILLRVRIATKTLFKW